MEDKRGCHDGTVPNSKYTRELRLEAVHWVLTGSGLSTQEAAMRLSLSQSTLEKRRRAFKAGKRKRSGSGRCPLTEMEVEPARVKREIAPVRMDRDIQKIAAAHFAQESLHGTR